MERGINRTATAITAISECNRQYIVAKGANPEKVFTVFNWFDADLIRPGDRMNSFRAAHGLGDDFIALFAGTMGWSQGVGVAVEAAKLLAGEPGLSFLFVGDGVERAGLERQAAGLSNVRFLPMQPRDVYPQVLTAADVVLVTLRPGVVTPTPSRNSTIYDTGRPVVANVPLGGDVQRVIAEAGAGVVTPAGDAKALADAVLALKRDPQRTTRWGIRGRQYAERHLSRTVCVRRNEEIFQHVVNAGT